MSNAKSLFNSVIVLSAIVAQPTAWCFDKDEMLPPASTIPTTPAVQNQPPQMTTAVGGAQNLGSVTPDSVNPVQGKTGYSSNGNGSPSNAPKNGAKQNGKALGEGDCVASEQLENQGIKNHCQSTYDWIDNSKLYNTIANAGGAAVVNTAGGVGAMRAQSAGTQSSVMKAAASTHQNAGDLQLGLGLSNTASGVYQIMLSREHKQNAQNNTQAAQNALSQAQSGNAMSGDNSQAQQQANLYNKAAAEQKKVERASMMAGVQATIQGVTQTLAGGLAIATAKQESAYADKLGDATGANFQLTSANVAVDANNPTTGTALNPGSSTDPAVASADNGVIGSTGIPSISPPINPDGSAGGPGAGPKAGTFAAGNPQSAGAGGASAGLGVGSLSPASPQQEQTGPRMVESKSNTAYGAGGGGGYVTGGGVASEKSGDLGFLAQLLPKPQEEVGKQEILDYGGRSPASLAPYSFLGKDVNIFQRVSDRTAAKLKSGDVGG